MNQWKKVERRIAKLATKALKDKPVWNAPKGTCYLEDVNVGQLIQVHESNTQAILLNKNDCAASVYCTKHKDDDPFYLGERKWALKTIVTIIGE
tara:strand:+ start:303 stop:584 length:282 start_codon:yes stop_codon:yes gene_type:complete